MAVGTPDECMAQGVPESALYSEALNLRSNPRCQSTSGVAQTSTQRPQRRFTIGFVWTPYAFEGFSASVDFFSIEVEDYIDRLNGNPL